MADVFSRDFRQQAACKKNHCEAGRRFGLRRQSAATTALSPARETYELGKALSSARKRRGASLRVHLEGTLEGSSLFSVGPKFEKAPTSKLQAPENIQAPTPKLTFNPYGVAFAQSGFMSAVAD